MFYRIFIDLKLSDSYLILLHSKIVGIWPEWAEYSLPTTQPKKKKKDCPPDKLSCLNLLKGQDRSAARSYIRSGHSPHVPAAYQFLIEPQARYNLYVLEKTLVNAIGLCGLEIFKLMALHVTQQNSGIPHRCLHSNRRNLVLY